MEDRKSDRPQAGWFSYNAMGQGPAPAQPLDEAYSRVTNPERFGPLHEWALETVARLNREYEIVLEEGMGLDEELERGPLARPTIKLTPRQDSGAPVTMRRLKAYAEDQDVGLNFYTTSASGGKPFRSFPVGS